MEEGNTGFSCDRACKERFTGPGCPHKQHSPGDACADIKKLLRILKKVHYF